MVFEIANDEFLEWKEFREEHKNCVFVSTDGGKYSFIFTPTGVGTIIQVRCNACDKIKDITNIDDW